MQLSQRRSDGGDENERKVKDYLHHRRDTSTKESERVVVLLSIVCGNEPVQLLAPRQKT